MCISLILDIVAAEKGKNGHNYITAGQTITFEAFIIEIASRIGAKIPLVTPKEFLQTVAYISGIIYIKTNNRDFIQAPRKTTRYNN